MEKDLCHDDDDDEDEDTDDCKFEEKSTHHYRANIHKS